MGIRKLLSGKHPPIQEVIDAGVVPFLVSLLDDDYYPQLQYECAWGLTNIASGTRQQCKSVIDRGAVPKFLRLLSSEHPQIVEQAVWGIANIASDNDDFKELIIN